MALNSGSVFTTLWSAVLAVATLFVDDLLPLVHCVWKPFVHRFTDEEPLVTIKVIPYLFYL